MGCDAEYSGRLPTFRSNSLSSYCLGCTLNAQAVLFSESLVIICQGIQRHIPSQDRCLNWNHLADSRLLVSYCDYANETFCCMKDKAFVAK
jgi:hypothetical protein